MSWDDPDSDPVGDVFAWMRARYGDYVLSDDVANIFTPISMRRPVWPRVVLFPRWERAAWRARVWRTSPLIQREKLLLRHRLYGLAEVVRNVDCARRRRG